MRTPCDKCSKLFFIYGPENNSRNPGLFSTSSRVAPNYPELDPPSFFIFLHTHLLICGPSWGEP